MIVPVLTIKFVLASLALKVTLQKETERGRKNEDEEGLGYKKSFPLFPSPSRPGELPFPLPPFFKFLTQVSPKSFFSGSLALLTTGSEQIPAARRKTDHRSS